VKSGRPLFFRESASYSKILNVKCIFNTVKNSRATLFFRASANCSKIWNVKSIFNTVKIFRATLVFRESASCSKILNDKINFIAVKIFWTTLFFSGQAQVAQNSWIVKVYSIQQKFSGQLCFFQGKRRCWKILNSKKYIQYCEKFQGKICFQGKRKLLKILNVKSLFTAVKIFRVTLFFSGQAQVAQKSWTVKKFSIQCNSLGGYPCNLSCCSV